MLNQQTIDTIRAALTEYEHARSAFWDGEPQAMEDARLARVALAELEAMRDTRGGWMPLPDGKYTRPNWDGKGEVTLQVSYNGEELEEWHSSNEQDIEEIGLPPNYRLCRLTDVPDVAPPREVVETLRLVLTFAKRDENDSEDNWAGTATYINKRIDAALSWLAQWEGGE